MAAFASSTRRVGLNNILRLCSSSRTSPSSMNQRRNNFSVISCNPSQSTSKYHLLQHSCNAPQHVHQFQIRFMAGHNKWSKIKRKKAANDVARAKDHTRAARAIEAASRACQGDMSDMHLQTTISAARAVQLPKERMEKAIERGANPHAKAEGEEYVVRRYDGMIPTGNSGKVAVIIETLTENKNRTAANVRHLVTNHKTGGELLPTGANDWMFEHVGLIWVSKHMTNGENTEKGDDSSVEVDIDALLECALEGGATDVDFGLDENIDEELGDENATGNFAMIKCEPNDMLHLVQSLKADGYTTTQFEKQWLVKDEGNKVVLDEESAEKFEKFLNSMDDDLDVTDVYHSASFIDDNI